MSMRRWFFILTLFASALASPVLAHPEDEDWRMRNPQVMAMTNADFIVQRLIRSSVIDPSWSGITPSSAQTRQRNGAYEWVVIYRNPTVADPAQRVLYVMLSMSGDYIAANYTGE
jgi:hypothetical protein